MGNEPCILAFDTALGGCSVGVSGSDGACFEDIKTGERGQAEILVPMIDDCLRRAEVAYDAIDAIVTTVGPGSFTGLRVGLSTARSMGLALKKPVIGVTTLEVVARQVWISGWPDETDVLLAVLETKRADFYFQLFSKNGVVLCDPAAGSGGEIIRALAGRRAIGTGDAAVRFARETGGKILLLPGNDMIMPAVLAAIGKEKIKTNKEFPQAMPLYLREADVTVK